MHRSPALDALIKALSKQESNSSEFVSILVPLEVVRELDRLKESREEQKRSAARKAISTLNDLQQSRSEKKACLLYRGQRENELIGPRARRGDDGILDAVVLFKNAGAVEVNLVTQDRNFALRAQTEGFEAPNVAQALDFVTSLNLKLV
jgi:predicted ribonuclease YlaK